MTLPLAAFPKAVSESDLKAALLLAAPLALPTMRLFVRPIMRVKRDDRVYSIGIKGQSDLYGLVRGGGHVELELKDVHTITSKAQRDWRAFCRACGKWIRCNERIAFLKQQGLFPAARRRAAPTRPR